MFPLLVTEELDVWPEKDVRRRIWVCLYATYSDTILFYAIVLCQTSLDVLSNSISQMTVNEAKEVCAHWWMKEALDEFIRQLTCMQRKEEEPLGLCRLEYHRSEESRMSIGELKMQTKKSIIT